MARPGRIALVLSLLLVAGMTPAWAMQPGNVVLVSTSNRGVLKANDESSDPALSADGKKVAFPTKATNLDPSDTDSISDIYIKDLSTGDIMLASTSDSGVKGNGHSASPSLSSDGTKVAFGSTATNLDPADTDTISDIYVKDLITGDLTLATTSDAGVKGNGSNADISLSGNGSKVAFVSTATNLDPADTDLFGDIYVKELTTGDIALASTSDVGVKGNSESSGANISADGTAVAFATDSSNLDAGDTDSIADVFVKTLPTGNITLASTSDAGVKGNDYSFSPTLSSNGAKVGFESQASNLDPADSDRVNDIFVKDLTSGDIALASTSSGNTKGNADSFQTVVSGDGSYVGFYSMATNLDPLDADAGFDVYVKDLVAGILILASRSDAGVKGNGESLRVALASDGLTAAFESEADNLSPNDNDTSSDIFVKDLSTGNTSLASWTPFFVKGNGNSSLFFTSLSGDGTTIAFESAATNLDPLDDDSASDIYVQDLSTGDVRLISTSDGGNKGNGFSFTPSIAEDGNTVAFVSASTNLDPSDTDSIPDVYVKDLVTGDISLASTSDSEVKADGESGSPVLPADGSFVAFASEATNLDPADTDSFTDIFVKNLVTGDLTLASTSSNGVKGNSDSFQPTLSEDATQVAFASQATNLDPSDTDGFGDVYVKDLSVGGLTLASTSDLGIKGNGQSEVPSISADGSRVAFSSEATNLDPSDADPFADVYVKDLSTADIVLASTSDMGVKGIQGGATPRLSADGGKVAFTSASSNLDPADGDSLLDIYVKTLSTGSIALASTSDAGVKGNGLSDVPSLSADGTRVGFRSSASNLDVSDSDSLSDVYVKELPVAVAVETFGHVHTDYSGDGQAGPGDVHLRTTIEDNDIKDSTRPTGSIRYGDLRASPYTQFRCRGRPSSLISLGPNSILIDGRVQCDQLADAKTFTLILTDNGPNPPNQDEYLLALYDRDRRLVYEWGDLTTLSLGDLLVTTS
jgi:hypothetical protein